MSTFIHLRACSAYSLKYGTTQPHDLVARAREYEMPALALTDLDGGWRSLARLLTSLNTYKTPEPSRTPILTLDFLQQFSEYSRNLLALHGPESPVGAAIALHRSDLALECFAQSREREDGPIADILDSARQLVPPHTRHVERKNAEAFLKSSAEMVALAEEISRAAGERTARELLTKSTCKVEVRS